MHRRSRPHFVSVGTIFLVLAIVFTSAQGQQGTQVKGGVVTPPTTGSTATTATTTGTTSTTGTTTTGSTSGDVENFSEIVRIEEKRAVTSQFITAQSSTIVTDSNRHVLRLKLRLPMSQTSGTNSTGPWTSVTGIGAVAVAPGVELLPINQSSPILQVNSQPGVQALVNYAPTTINYAPGYVSSVQPWYCYVQRGSSGTLSGGSIKYYYYEFTHFTQYDQLNEYVSGNMAGTWMVADLVADKLPLEGVSADSRKVYGKANLDGELPGDPNAEITNNNFVPWTFKGGHFVGNMVYGSSRDQSGTARTQLRLANMSDANEYLVACLTLFTTGLRGNNAPGSIGLYRPSASDPNLNQGFDTIWSTRWNLTPGNPNPVAGDFSTQPYYTQAPATTVASEYGQLQYLNWQLPYVNYVWKTEYGGSGNLNDDNMWTHFGLTQNDESPTTWQYFASEWIESISGQQFPLNDSRPRVWKVRYAAQ